MMAMFDNLERCLRSEIVGQAGLVQLRGQRRIVTACAVKNGFVEQFSNASLSGVGVRAFADNRSWGFCSTSRLDYDSVNQALKDAVKLAMASSRIKNKEIPLESTKPTNADLSVEGKKSLRHLSAEEIAEIPLQACEGTREAGEQIADAKATFISIEDDKYFLSSEGSRIHQNLTRVMLFVNVLAKNGGLICPASDNLGHTGGLELFEKNTPYALGKAVAEKAVRLLGAKAPPSGTFRVVLHPTLCATLLHEAIGHPLEADLAMAGGGFGEQFGKQVSSNLVTVYDDGQVQGGLGYLPYDDEGIESKRTYLIRGGVLKSFMHDRTSAATARVRPTGNAHAWDYSVEPLIRQTNIGIEGGDFSIEEMIEDVKEGLFLEGTFGGQADANADFTFGFQNANWIRNGELSEELRGANVAGNAIEVFKGIDAVEREVVLRPGACGKFQFAVQGRVVPAIRCKIMVGGTGGA